MKCKGYSKLKVYQQMQYSDNAEIRLLVPCGARNEKRGEIGISHLIEHMNLAFAKKEECDVRVYGHTTYEYTEYIFICANRYDDVSNAVHRVINILEGNELDEMSLKDIKKDVILEIHQHKENPYFNLRNELLRKILPKDISDILPVGEKENVEAISFKAIIEYFADNYLDENAAICISSKYDFMKAIKSYGNIGLIKSYSPDSPKNDIKWSFGQSFYEKGKIINSVYFIQSLDFNTTEEFIFYELRMTLFLVLFDNVFQKRIEELNAVVYQNRVERNTSIYTYEFKNDKIEILNNIEFQSLIQSILFEVYDTLKEKMEDMEVIVKTLLHDKFANTGFFEISRMNFLYGIDLNMITEEMLKKQYKKIRDDNFKIVINKLF